MTVLQELASLYERRAARAGWPRAGFSTESVGAEVVLRRDGSVEAIRPLLAPDARGKMQPRKLAVPAAVKRTSGVRSNLLWDKTAYALGVTAVPGPEGKSFAGQGGRTAAEHAAFREAQLALLEGVEDEALNAFVAFCRTWEPSHFARFPDALPLLDQNVVFRVGEEDWLHDRAEALALLLTPESEEGAMCLVTGRFGPLVRLHPTIKGVPGAQSSGASLVSFNNDAETSHGKVQGENAPTSEAAAFAYGTALNALLARGSGNNLRIGDATVAFWARGDAALSEEQVEDLLRAAWHGDAGVETDEQDEEVLRSKLAAVAHGRVPEGTALHPTTQVFVLGLASNAARLSVRFWHPGTLGDLARHIVAFWNECAIEPSPFQKAGTLRLPKPWSLLYDLAPQRDAKKISPTLGGDLMRAILSGSPYPATLLAAVIGRLRVEGDPDPKRDGNLDGRRAALLRAVLIRNHKLEVPVALDEEADDVAYLLGRLFGAYAYAERSYQERGAGLRAKYMGAASATPARVFPALMRGYEHNLDALRKAGGMKAGAGVKADRAVAAILGHLPGGVPLPGALPLEEQGRFFIGFYHQISAFYTKAEDAAEALIETPDQGDDE
ncbi:type I-C CRISPR-associated protein Cas8c/Csd1 [Paracoccus luteus]|uniref:type I-C CRISPR-associated protein Cas8c/Csd1 n=1 Tax=Paracoccus luteus TaxID=2508543 RepID=UPI001430B6CC|nr:type I-C CRISPR-associated protein Cas8c/Csd1 [Paracoccus luteus]